MKKKKLHTTCSVINFNMSLFLPVDNNVEWFLRLLKHVLPLALTLSSPKLQVGALSVAIHPSPSEGSVHPNYRLGGGETQPITA